MAKKTDRNRRSERLPDPDDLYFDDDLDTITRGLPTEEEYLPQEEDAEIPEEKPLTEGVGRIGVRMVGLPADEEEAQEDSIPEVDDYFPEDDDEEEEPETLRASRYSARPAEDEMADEYLTPRERERRKPQNAKATPMPPRRKKQQRVPVDDEETAKAKHPVLRMFCLIMVTVVLLGMIGMMLLTRTMMPDNSLLQLPEKAVSASVGPVQKFFSGITESIADYFRKLKYRATLEEEYLKLREENEQLAIDAAFSEEYKRQNAMLQSMIDEINTGNNRELNPTICQIIGREQGNYFSTFTIDQGSRSGIEPFMAVTVGGALVGYTEEVYETTATVRTIIDSSTSIPGLIQSSRDQGTLRGTLGVDGTALCRMYYLPEDHLPRPGDTVVTSGIGMSFPKGIPIGTVRESTRGTEENKKYVVVEPLADFEHLEFVIVYRYKPAAEAVEGRDNAAVYSEYVPTDTARPYPTLRIGTTQVFGETPTPAVLVTPTPTPAAETTATPTASPTATPSATPSGPVYQYQSPLSGPTPSPSPTPTPSPTPLITIDPSQMTWEDD